MSAGRFSSVHPSEGGNTGGFCPRTSPGPESPRPWPKPDHLFFGLGAGALLWFLVRVVPKPSRAAYPCQRAAAPLAGSFLLWLAALVGARLSWRHAKEHARHSRIWKAALCFAAATAAAATAIVCFPSTPAQARPAIVHGSIGVAKGIRAGRVVWVHAPDATDWAGFSSSQHWWQTNHTDLATVEAMFSQAIRGVAGESTDAAAWEAIFRYFNAAHGRGTRGYQPGEKVAIKINLTACNARSLQVDPTTYEKNADVMNSIDNSPQMLLALLRQLVYTVGVKPADISLGDPTGMLPNFMWNLLHPEFPDAHYFDNHGGSGRERVQFSNVPFYWSTPAAAGKRQDYLPVPFAQAAYLVNFAILKGHSAGVTVCGKNLYGALLRCPDGYLRDVDVQDYYDMHSSLAGPGSGWATGTGHYRALVDLMGHRELGAKTVLYLVDGLFGGYYWDSHPYPWKMPPFGDGVTGDWPSSLFASQDPVAIDSVAYDFLLKEWPDVVSGGGGAPGSLLGSAEDYLHEAAQADAPPSGTFYDPAKAGVRLASLGTHEHWNNPVDMQYSRNLGLDQGIELVKYSLNRPQPQLALRRQDHRVLLSWPASLWDYRLQSSDNLSPAANWVALTDRPVFYQGQNVVTNTIDAYRQFYRLVK